MNAGSGSPSGFSILEVVIALAMAAALAAYAVPTYVTYAARGHRIDAVVALYRAAQHVSAAAFGAGRVPVSQPLPAGLDRAPEHGRAVYRLELSPAGERSGGYVLRAAPVEEGPMRGDACGTFVLDGLGARSNRAAAGDVIDAVACWSGRAA